MLERVASEAGYTRGALYHLFANKEELALAVVRWVEESWNAEVGRLADEEADPVEALLLMARGHAVYCRRDVAGVLMTLRMEFAGQDHPVGRAIAEIVDRVLAVCADRIAAGRATGAIPRGRHPSRRPTPTSAPSRASRSRLPATRPTTSNSPRGRCAAFSASRPFPPPWIAPNEAAHRSRIA
ncbi:TetR/AcrR family transcriptional regulator [Nonomuraea recticatena]|uniref:TetR/AcrR family transcriptional regulator n=1 Tax=Nonomuraea recticatena TaxID=46178 RepID=UPI0036161F93